MDNPGETLPSKRFALSLPDIADSDFERIHEYLVDTVTHEAMRLRVRCAVMYGISIFQTEATVTPDPDRPNVVTVTARPLAVNVRSNTTI